VTPDEAAEANVRAEEWLHATNHDATKAHKWLASDKNLVLTPNDLDGRKRPW
jgi:hypothetical protein